MRILHLNDYHRAGGCEIILDRMIGLQREAGFEVDAYYGADEPGGARSVLGYIDSPRHRRAVAARLKAFRPDVVHLHNVYHVLSPGILTTVGRYARAVDAPVVMTAHDHHLLAPSAGFNVVSGGTLEPADTERFADLGYVLRQRWDDRGPAHSTLKVCQHVWNYRVHDRRRVLDRVMAPSRFLAELLRRAELPAVHLPNPLGPPRERRAAASGDRLAFVFVGRLAPEKGLLPLLARLPDAMAARLTIVGDGVQRRALESAAAALPSWTIEFTGAVEHDAALRHIADADVLVLPSVCCENQPTVLTEALTAGTNILVADRGGLPEIVEDSGVGYVFDPADTASLESALQSIAAAHAESRLNAFDASPYLAELAADRWLERLAAVYANSA